MLSTRHLTFGVLAAAASAAFMSAPAQARNVTCGQPYTVVSGDTLSEIAKDAYGSPREFTTIYTANSRTIGSNPGIIEVGMRLDIPCLNAPLQASKADNSKITTEQTAGVLPLPDQNTIRVITATDWAPFTNEDQDQGGLITEIMNVALDQADGKPDYQIDFINDWGAHLQPLISDHAYDFSIAWFRPNCEVVDRLGDGSKFRCNNLAWSEPLFEQIFGFYTRSNGMRPVSHADLMGSTICRPAGYAMFQLEEHNLIEPNVTLVRPASVNECFQGLVDGTYDVVAIASDTAEGSIQELGADDKVHFNEGLSQVLTIHAVISNTHPRMQEYLDTLNSGVQKIKDNGEWFEMVRRHMTAHRQMTGS